MATFGPRSVSSITTRPSISVSFGGALRVASFEDLDDAREPVRDVGTGDTARVEGPHRRRARLANRLGGDDADRVPDLAQVVRRKEDAVALAADAELAPALEHRPDGDDEALGGIAELVLHPLQHLHRRDLALFTQDRLPGLPGRERLVDARGKDVLSANG